MLLALLSLAFAQTEEAPPESSVSTVEITIGEGGKVLACSNQLHISSGAVRLANGPCDDWKQRTVPTFGETPTDAAPVTFIYQHSTAIVGRPPAVGAPSLVGMRVLKSSRFDYAVTPTGVANCKVVEATPASQREGLCGYVRDFYAKNGPHLTKTVLIQESQLTVVRPQK